MALSNRINQIRTDVHLSQEQFADILGVSRQSVQKWESGTATPELEKLIKISKLFDITLDALVLDSNGRTVEELNRSKVLKPRYECLPSYESYACNLATEYQQSAEEGLDIAAYGDVFAAVGRLPQGEIKERLSDVLFDVVLNAKTVENYPYVEPSTLAEIQSLRKGEIGSRPVDHNALPDKIHGAWMGRICGCLLGKTVECIHTDELIPFLRETGNYPMHRYILHSDLNEEILNRYEFRFACRCYADQVDGMPADDDTNYTVMAQHIIAQYGRGFAPGDVAHSWVQLQRKNAYCTAERVAYCNFIKGFVPPDSAQYKNPYREWIGAQIRGDYFGYINPGDPEQAADMAFRDASISHVKNGIYGEMFVAAMLAAAAAADRIPEIIRSGLAQIPHTSRLHEAVTEILNQFETGVPQSECFAHIHRRYNEYTSHGWCHTISNAMIVAAALLYGGGDYGKSVCMAVETGFDTDCNGATVGSILGMANGLRSIGTVWTNPIRDTLHTTIFGKETVKISDCVRQTLRHIDEK